VPPILFVTGVDVARRHEPSCSWNILPHAAYDLTLVCDSQEYGVDSAENYCCRICQATYLKGEPRWLAA
jgi:hypothetical protein